MGSKTIGLAKLGSATNTMVFGDNVGGNIVTFDGLAVKQHLYASNTNLYTDINSNVAQNTVMTVSSENEYFFTRYGTHFINSKITANAGKTVWSQDQKYGLTIFTDGTDTESGNAKIEWMELETGLTKSTPLIINYDGSLTIGSNLNVNLLQVSTINAVSGNAIFNGNLKITANGANAALRITQSGTGNVLVIDDATDDTTPLIIDSSGNLVKGANAVYSSVGRTGVATITATQFHNQSLALFTWSTNRTFRGGLQFVNSLGSSPGVITPIADGTATNLGDILWTAYDAGSVLRPAAMIFASTIDTSSTRVLGRLNFAVTRADTGATSPSVEMRLEENGYLQINSGYGSLQNTFGVRAWVNFDACTKANLLGNFVQNSGNVTGTISNNRIYINTSPTAHGLITGSTVNVSYKTGDSNVGPAGKLTTTRVDDFIFYVSNTGSGYWTGGAGYPGISFRSGTLYLERNSIRGSGAVRSITDLGVGIKIINFQYDMPDVNYSVVGTTGNLGTVGIVSSSVGLAPETSYVQIRTVDTANTPTDFAYNNIIVVR
jgi:hypothetical protein